MAALAADLDIIIPMIERANSVFVLFIRVVVRWFTFRFGATRYLSARPFPKATIQSTKKPEK